MENQSTAYILSLSKKGSLQSLPWLCVRVDNSVVVTANGHSEYHMGGDPVYDMHSASKQQRVTRESASVFDGADAGLPSGHSDYGEAQRRYCSLSSNHSASL